MQVPCSVTRPVAQQASEDASLLERDVGKHVAVITTDPGPAFRCRNRTDDLALLDSRRDGHRYGYGYEIGHEWCDKWVA